MEVIFASIVNLFVLVLNKKSILPKFCNGTQINCGSEIVFDCAIWVGGKCTDIRYKC